MLGVSVKGKLNLCRTFVGFLPFRPYGGRKNKETMFYITTRKESGVISGVQTTDNGPVDWKRELPPSCQLSAGLKFLITPLLAGLMEVDTRKRWSYDRFFGEVQKILGRLIVYVFYVNKIQSLRVYLEQEENKTKQFEKFAKLVMEQTDIPSEHQFLLHKDLNLTAIFEKGNTSHPVFPITSPDDTLILCHRENNNVSLDWDVKDLLKFPTFPALVNVENDASIAKLCCGVGYSYKRRVEKICRSVDLISVAVKTIVAVIVSELTTLSKDVNQVQSIVHAVAQQLNMMSQFHAACQCFLAAVPDAEDRNISTRVDSMAKHTETQQTTFGKLTSRLQTLQQPIKVLYSRIVEGSTLMKDWEEPTSVSS